MNSTTSFLALHIDFNNVLIKYVNVKINLSVAYQ